MYCTYMWCCNEMVVQRVSILSVATEVATSILYIRAGTDREVRRCHRRSRWKESCRGVSAVFYEP